MLSFVLRFLPILGLAVACAAKSPLVIDRSTPEKAFETWKNAVIKSEQLALIECYIMEAREGMRRELAETTSNGIEAMRSETARTKFEIEKIVFQQNKAFVRIRRELDGESDVEVLTMVQEEGQWLLQP